MSVFSLCACVINANLFILARQKNLGQKIFWFFATPKSNNRFLCLSDISLWHTYTHAHSSCIYTWQFTYADEEGAKKYELSLLLSHRLVLTDEQTMDWDAKSALKSRKHSPLYHLTFLNCLKLEISVWITKYFPLLIGSAMHECEAGFMSTL